MKMTLSQRLAALETLRQILIALPPPLTDAVLKAGQANSWFDQRHVQRMLDAICTYMLAPEALQKLIAHYKLTDVAQPRIVAQVPAGNLPLVGFHDFLLTFFVGHTSQIKLSDKDNVLFPVLMRLWQQAEPAVAGYINIVERLSDFDAVIATGSNNTARYFEKYFGSYPHIIRHNRHGVAVLHGNESAADFEALTDDIFAYFGLGCRNVSHVFLPAGMSVEKILDVVVLRTDVMDNTRYANNHDYQRAILLFNGVPHLSTGNMMWLEDDSIASPISMVHYSRYADVSDLANMLDRQAGQIQSVATNMPISTKLPQVKLGHTQRPGLMDYPDGVDVVAFLLTL
jgi:hypothetical protein